MTQSPAKELLRRAGRAKRPWLLTLAGLVVLAAPLASAGSAGAETKWLCRPGQSPDPCRASLTTSVTSAGGKTRVVRPKAARHPKIDCFYVYPTVSEQSTPNANLHVDSEERAIAHRQASRFSQRCRVFAPMYHQITVTGVFSVSGDPDRAYADVRRAWHTYLRRFNHGRGVVLVGHSQGSFMLDRLIAEEIDDRSAVRSRVISALLTGGNVTVRRGSDKGGDFRHVPACRSARQTGCVVAYSTFADTPPSGTVFGALGGVLKLIWPWVGTGDPSQRQILCVNPAALGGGTGDLRPYFRTTAFPGSQKPSWDVYDRPPTAPTPWVASPHLYRARCEHTSTMSWLQIEDIGGTGDNRSRVEVGPLGPAFGLHPVDLNLALGNLVGLVGSESKAYLKRSSASR